MSVTNDKKPLLVVFAGPNGSGKSTITRIVGKTANYSNADDVVSSTGMSYLEAARQVEERRLNSIRNREDFSFETVLSSDHSMNIIRRAKEAGYFVKCFFVLTVSPELNVHRVKSRVESGGHDVDAETIVRRYSKSLGNIKELLTLCDILHIYDNTVEPKRILRKHKESLMLFADSYWPVEKIVELIK